MKPEVYKEIIMPSWFPFGQVISYCDHMAQDVTNSDNDSSDGKTLARSFGAIESEHCLPF